jgi:hypothetical protein
MESATTSSVQRPCLRKIPLAIVLEGVSEKWQMNVLQVLATPTSANVVLEGRGPIDAIAFVLSQAQARHLATLITELLGSDTGPACQLAGTQEPSPAPASGNPQEADVRKPLASTPN